MEFGADDLGEVEAFQEICDEKAWCHGHYSQVGGTGVGIKANQCHRRAPIGRNQEIDAKLISA